MLLYYVEKLSRRGRILCLYPNLWTVIKIEKKKNKKKEELLMCIIYIMYHFEVACKVSCN